MLLLDLLPLVRYHWRRLASHSFNPTDGPPARAGVLIKYAEWLTEPEQNNSTWVADILWPAIDLDLQWISLHWNQSSYVDYLQFHVSL